MSRNEIQTSRDLIEPALKQSGWSWDWQLVIGPGKVNIAGGAMYDEGQRLIADYLLRVWQMPLAVVEAKAEAIDASNGIQQASHYAKRLGLRFSISTNGHQYILTDNETGEYETLAAPPTPGDILNRLGRNIHWGHWRPVFEYPWHVDQVAPKKVRPFQQMAIFETLCRFAQDERRVLLLMATGTGKTYTVFQLAWKLIHGGILQNNRILFLTDRNSLQDQAYRAFAAFSEADRVIINAETVRKGAYRIGKIFFANYQTLDEQFEGKKLFQYYEPDFFDLVVVDECHRSGFGDWFAVLQHFSSAYQLGLTATPREIDQDGRQLTEEERRRDTHVYFTGKPDGEPAYTYSLKNAIEDGYLVPYLLEERLTNVDLHGYNATDGKMYTTETFEREIRLPDRTKVIAKDLWEQLNRHGLQHDKTIIFCVDDTHAAFMAQELRLVSGDDQYAGRITRSERNSHQLERNFAEVGRNKPRVAVTVDLLTTGFDAPDVKNIVFVRPVKSAILYKQMKGRGTRLCEDVDKRYFTIWDYAGASTLEDAEFDGHPANLQKPPRRQSPSKKPETPVEKPIAQNAYVYMGSTERYVCLADGQKIPFDEYREQSKEVIRTISAADMEELLRLWVDRNTRSDLRAELKDHDVYVAAFKHYYDLNAADDVDILAKVGFDLTRIPMRHDRVVRFWKNDEDWLKEIVLGRVVKQAEIIADPPSAYRFAAENSAKYTYPEMFKLDFWETCLDHYAQYGVDDLEKGQTYSAPQFVERFGPFSRFLQQYGGPQLLRNHLEDVKRHLYVRMGQ